MSYMHQSFCPLMISNEVSARWRCIKDAVPSAYSNSEPDVQVFCGDSTADV